MKIIGEREYKLLLELGLIDLKKISREEFLLRLRTSYVGADFNYPRSNNLKEVEIRLRDLGDLKTKLLSLSINFESYREHEMYLINAISTLLNIFEDVLIGDSDILHFVISLIALNAAHEVLWSGFDFINGKSEYIESIKAKSSTNTEQ